MGYRVSDKWSSLAYLSDHGPAMAGGPGPDGFGPYHEAALDLCRGVDLLIHDAQYTASELPFRRALRTLGRQLCRWRWPRSPASAE